RPAPEQKEGGVATAVASDPPWLLTLEPIQRKEVFIEILDVPHAKVVTVLEILSPSNKTKGNPGYKLYRTNQRELLTSKTSLIEIDLLRRSRHTVAAPQAALRERGQWDYLVCLHRGGKKAAFEVWPFTVRQRLPRIRVPLAKGDADIVLDLQAVFDRAYEEGAYSRWVDYRARPVVALPNEDADWADTLLRERGLRS